MTDQKQFDEQIAGITRLNLESWLFNFFQFLHGQRQELLGLAADGFPQFDEWQTCPECGATLRLRNAAMGNWRETHPGGIRISGNCCSCGKSFTVKAIMFEKPQEIPF